MAGCPARQVSGRGRRALGGADYALSHDGWLARPTVNGHRPVKNQGSQACTPRVRQHSRGQHEFHHLYRRSGRHHWRDPVVLRFSLKHPGRYCFNSCQRRQDLGYKPKAFNFPKPCSGSREQRVFAAPARSHAGKQAAHECTAENPSGTAAWRRARRVRLQPPAVSSSGYPRH